ncbi:MAG: transcriptional repressor [Opitutaceae bacterium]|nr:transcriptional repressor [Opitutaceae bacterium]
MTPAEKQQRQERFVAAHRDGGLPVTHQRRAVFAAILERSDHPTAEQVYMAVRQDLPQISRMTVHRILGTFVSLGLVAKTCHPGSAARFDPKVHPHHHLVCMDCGAILDLEDPCLDKIPWPKVNSRYFTIQGYQIYFRGRCARCGQEARRSSKINTEHREKSAP